jgi:hypothetical protein
MDEALGESSVDHIWAGQDRGPTASGFLNNVAIGDLALVPQGFQSSQFEPLFAFSGATAGNGLYVSNLDLSALTDYANEIQIDPTLTIYFVSAELNPSVDITGFPDAEHFLNGQFGGRLQWVPGGLGGAATKTLSGSYDKSTGKFQLNLSGAYSGQTNIIEASTNLVNWMPIFTNIGSTMFTDPKATNYPYRFYRTKTLP